MQEKLLQKYTILQFTFDFLDFFFKLSYTI